MSHTLQEAINAERAAIEQEYDDGLDMVERRRLFKLDKLEAIERLAGEIPSAVNTNGDGASPAADPPKAPATRPPRVSSSSKAKTPSGRKAAMSPAEIGERRSKVLQAMARLGGETQEGCTQAHIEQALGFDPRDHLKRLERDGKVKRTGEKRAGPSGRGALSPIYRLVRSAGTSDHQEPTSKSRADSAPGRAKKTIKAAVARILYTYPEGEQVSGTELVDQIRAAVPMEAQNSEVVAAALDELVESGDLLRVPRQDRKGFNYRIADGDE